MSSCVVLIDHQKAKIFTLGANGVTSKSLKAETAGHDSQGMDSQWKHEHAEKFFHHVAGQLNDVKEILVLGHGLGKEHFKHHIEKHHHTNLLKKIVGVETVDHETDAEVLAKARKFFKAWDNFNDVVKQ